MRDIYIYIYIYIVRIGEVSCNGYSSVTKPVEFKVLGVLFAFFLLNLKCRYTLNLPKVRERLS